MTRMQHYTRMRNMRFRREQRWTRFYDIVTYTLATSILASVWVLGVVWLYRAYH